MLHIPFDQYQRYRILRDAVVSFCRGEGKGFSLLEVGGYPGVIREFLPEMNILVLDRVRQPLQDYIIADGVLLPLKDDSHDFVVAIDVLEHIPPDRRVAFVQELVRVGRKMVCLAFPCYSKEAVWAEKQLEKYFRETFGFESEFLTEHRQFGLPKLKEVVRIAEKMRLPYLAYPSSHLYRWLMMMAATYTLDYFYPDSEKWSQGLHMAYNTCFYPQDNREPAYRKLVLLFLEGPAGMERVKKRFNKIYLKPDTALEKADLMQTFAPLLSILEEGRKKRKIPFGPFQVLKETLQENMHALASARKAEDELRGELEKVAGWAKDMDRSLKLKEKEAANLVKETETLRDEKARLEDEAGKLKALLEKKQKERDRWDHARTADRTYTRWLENIMDGKGSEEDLLTLKSQNILGPAQMARLEYEYARKGRKKSLLYWGDVFSRRRGYFAKTIEGFLLRDAVIFKSDTYWRLESAVEFIQTYFPDCRITVFSHQSNVDALLKRTDLDLITYTTRRDGLKKLRALRRMGFDMAAVMTGGEKIFRNLQFSAFFSRARYVLIFSRRGNVFWWNWSRRMEFYRECKLWYAEKIGLRQELNISELVISTFIWLMMNAYLCIRTAPYLLRKCLGRSKKPERKRRDSAG